MCNNQVLAACFRRLSFWSRFSSRIYFQLHLLFPSISPPDLCLCTTLKSKTRVFALTNKVNRGGTEVELNVCSYCEIRPLIFSKQIATSHYTHWTHQLNFVSLDILMFMLVAQNDTQTLLPMLHQDTYHREKLACHEQPSTAYFLSNV